MGNEFSSLLGPLPPQQPPQPPQQPPPQALPYYSWNKADPFKCIIHNTRIFGKPPPLDAKASLVFRYMTNVYSILLELIRQHLPELPEYGVKEYHVTDFRFYVDNDDDVLAHEWWWKQYEDALTFRKLDTFSEKIDHHPFPKEHFIHAIQNFHQQHTQNGMLSVPNLPQPLQSQNARPSHPHQEMNSRIDRYLLGDPHGPPHPLPVYPPQQIVAANQPPLRIQEAGYDMHSRGTSVSPLQQFPQNIDSAHNYPENHRPVSVISAPRMAPATLAALTRIPLSMPIGHGPFEIAEG